MAGNRSQEKTKADSCEEANNEKENQYTADGDTTMKDNTVSDPSRTVTEKESGKHPEAAVKTTPQ